MGAPFLGCFQISFLWSFLPHQSVQGQSQLKLAAYSALESRDSQLPWPTCNPGSWHQGIQLRLPLEVREAVLAVLTVISKGLAATSPSLP